MPVSPLANRYLALSEYRRDAEWSAWSDTGDMIRSAGRFALAPEVVALMARTPDPEPLLAAARNGIKMPHDPCWIEYSPIEVFRVSDGASHCGFLFWSDGDDICTRVVYRSAHQGPSPIVVLYPVDLILRPTGVVLTPTRHDLPEADMVEFGRSLYALGLFGLTFLLLLTAKNAPLEVGEADDLGRLNKARVKSGKEPLMSARPVTWNLTREQRRAVRAAKPFTADRRAAATNQMVRGHFKVRRTGVFWWSYHFRNATDDTSAGRDYLVR